MSEGQRRAMLRKCKKDVLVMCLLCDWYERVEFIIMPRLCAKEKGL